MALPGALISFKRFLRLATVLFIILTIAIAGYNAWVKQDPDVFFQEIGGRIVLIDRTLDTNVNLMLSGTLDSGTYAITFFDSILSLLSFFYILRFWMWIFKIAQGDNGPRLLYAIIIMAVLEVFYFRIFYGQWDWPFIGFINTFAHFVPLFVQPFANWFNGIGGDITPINETLNQTITNITQNITVTS